MMPIGKRIRDADRCFLQLPGAHVLPAEGAAWRHAEAVDVLLTVVEFDNRLPSLWVLHGFPLLGKEGCVPQDFLFRVTWPANALHPSNLITVMSF